MASTDTDTLISADDVTADDSSTMRSIFAQVPVNTSQLFQSNLKLLSVDVGAAILCR
ncbi:uncharacterized protein V6R79_024429 [Siganus canaliculatus]